MNELDQSLCQMETTLMDILEQAGIGSGGALPTGSNSSIALPSSPFSGAQEPPEGSVEI